MAGQRVARKATSVAWAKYEPMANASGRAAGGMVRNRGGRATP